MENKEEQPKVMAEMSEEQKAKIEQRNKHIYAMGRLRELQNLFHYLENINCKNRQERKQFRRDLITQDNFAQGLLDSVIKHFDTGVRTEDAEASNSPGRGQ